MLRPCLRLLKNKKKNAWKIVATFLVLLVVYLEAAVYFLNRSLWPSLTCAVEPTNYHRVLLVADPQLLGEETETWIARWDCDRFLSKTFKLALEYVEPSMVIFLGDLFDEGSTATDDEYERYHQRFKRIFRTADRFFASKTIYIPGDNDIGGENEDITPQKLNHFDKYFGLKPDVVSFHNVSFVKINYMLKSAPHPPSGSDKVLTILLSHMPLLGASSFFTEKVIRDMKPSLIISAHDHKAVHFVGDLETGERTLIESMSTDERSLSDSKWRFQSSKKHTNEILVPTCSYRMGVKETGYGVLLIDSKGDNVCYSVLWLPDRLYHLKIYFYVFLPVTALYLIMYFFGRNSLVRSQ
ncbi:Metallophosphoesterase 1 [Nesidiocoris tenuis]|uniref:Metallophosphoesterase 1 n=1 Tax=Nesidiocoris tenuis TaxID=355587 RepID=A0ABN7ACY6_9HEMI|nr:Metallophosphoesterase 1 [Nesidiocoris tenuis]